MDCDGDTHAMADFTAESISDRSEKLIDIHQGYPILALIELIHACHQGIEFYWGDELIGTRITAFGTAEDAIDVSSKEATLEVSFIAKPTCHHIFELYSNTYKITALLYTSKASSRLRRVSKRWTTIIGAAIFS
jgi:hypothetical protein